ncbi:ACT domain-containing protein [Propionispora vibrioides]|uniref:Uncharacterized conserved protein, contains tandem ACT domains n=1 Tax=Propionispora vibrioides TaxID=112903 RepID=A0A1H8X1U6_9FIRM|nr:ACT domain-containing protein [Propionispora vibrioides]SEP33836.1 Uncharacterized conserved protein, contains tandem ACT domains [Propionispora vibrioides]
MIIQQVSVFLENQPGTLIGVLTVLKENGVNIRALSLADTADFGILRLIVDDPQALTEILRKAGLTAKLTAVLAVTVKDRPGDLAEQIEKLAEASINIEYMYAFAAVNDKDAHVALKVDDVVKAEQILG